MESHLSDVVRSLSGRDAGETLLVIGEEGSYLLLANGRDRRAEKPKRKKLRHVQILGCSDTETAERLRAGQALNNGDIRRALAPWGGAEQDYN